LSSVEGQDLHALPNFGKKVAIGLGHERGLDAELVFPNFPMQEFFGSSIWAFEGIVKAGSPWTLSLVEFTILWLNGDRDGGFQGNRWRKIDGVSSSSAKC
jgi:hypothetical protein